MTPDKIQSLDRRREQAEKLLIDRGAADLSHPGGTLLEHSRRVAEVMRRWNAPPEWQLAALCHACYGTAGYRHALLDPADRETLRSVIGVGPERIVYLYASCDRDQVIPHSAGQGPSRSSTGSQATSMSQARTIYGPFWS